MESTEAHFSEPDRRRVSSRNPQNRSRSGATAGSRDYLSRGIVAERPGTATGRDMDASGGRGGGVAEGVHGGRGGGDEGVLRDTAKRSHRPVLMRGRAAAQLGLPGSR